MWLLISLIGRRKKRIHWKNIRKKTHVYFPEFKKHVHKLSISLSNKVRYRGTVAKLRKGDIILASPRTIRLSLIALVYRIVLQSKYVHSMLYIGDKKILHTTSKQGVVIGRLPRKIFDKNRYSIFRVKHFDQQQRDQVITEALRWKDRKLDHAGLITNVPAKLFGLQKPLIRLEKNRVWCSKLVYEAFSSIGIQLVPKEKSENITSEDLKNSPVLKEI